MDLEPAAVEEEAGGESEIDQAEAPAVEEPEITEPTLVEATEEGDLVRIEVADTGYGFSSFQKAGVGIGNVRERIKLLYGGKAHFIVEENRPSGVRAIIEVPKHDIQSHPC